MTEKLRNDYMKKTLRFLAFALIALVFIGTFAFLYKNSKPEKEVYQ